jgi:hypothetical protein
VLIVSDPANLERREEIRGLADLTDPRRTGQARAAEIAAREPIIVLFQYSVHGDEPAGFEAAMQVAYQMLAGEDSVTQHIRRNVVLVLNPSANPDGHERFAAWYNSVAVGADHPLAFEQQLPWSVTGRYNHFRFDMNRDLIAQSQREVRIMADGLLRWHPQVFVDHHSTTPTYFFPPVAPAVNQNLPAQTTRWFDVFGRGNAAAFDRQGWQYFVRGVFDFFYVGYWDEWSTFQGATGMTYETDGGPEFNKRRDDGTITTFRDGIAHHFVASLATLETAADNRQARLLDYWEFRRSAMNEAATDRMKRVVLVPGRDPAMTARVVGLLLRNGIEVSRLGREGASAAARSFLGGAPARRTFPSGSYVIDLGQPQRRIAKALLEANAQLQQSFVDEQIAKFLRNRRRGEDADKEDYGFYDVTAWSLPHSFNLEAYWTEDTPAWVSQPVIDAALAAPPSPGMARSAYLFRNDNQGAASLAWLDVGFKLAVALQPLRADGRDWPRGTFVARVQRNRHAPRADRRTRAGRGVTVTAVQSAFADTGNVGTGSGDVVALNAPRILVGVGDGVSETSWGWLWDFLQNELAAPFTPVALRNVGRMTDLEQFNVFLLPDGSGSEMQRQLGDGGVKKLRVGSIGRCGDRRGRRRQAARRRDVGLSSVVAVGSDTSAKADTTVQADFRRSLRDGPRARGAGMAARRGLRATIDPPTGSPGLRAGRLPVFLDGSTFWTPSKGGANPIVFAGDSLVLSGFVWPDNTVRLLKNTAWAVVENQGRGRVVLFLGDPLFRGFWRGTARLLTNAILVGPTR